VCARTRRESLPGATTACFRRCRSLGRRASLQAAELPEHREQPAPGRCGCELRDGQQPLLPLGNGPSP
jgi:hypothetical protein